MNVMCTWRGIIAAGLLLTIVPTATAKYGGGPVPDLDGRPDECYRDRA